MTIEPFASLAAEPDAPLDELALALAAEFRPVDADAALAELDRLGSELAALEAVSPVEQADACRTLLGEREGFAGDREEYDHPKNSMLDLVVERRRGLPILVSAVYAEVARRAGIPIVGVGLPGHYVVGHFGTDPPLLLDPFAGGVLVAPEAPRELVRPWRAHETALRMLNNLVSAYAARLDLVNTIRAAELRLSLPLDARLRDHLVGDLRAFQARLN